MDIPKLVPKRAEGDGWIGDGLTVQLVRVTISGGVVVCKDDAIRRDVEALKPPGGPSGADPNPDWTLARECKLWMAARIIEQTSNGNGQPPGHGVVE
jgi:hypothetical protein